MTDTVRQPTPDSPVLTVVIPTYNELDNVHRVYQALTEALPGIAWEVIFVDDDSPDGTWRTVRELAARDARVRCLRRIGRTGLASAYLEGVLASHSPFVAAMDADLQHDERLLPAMLETLQQRQADIVIGSRYLGTGSTGALPSKRVAISRWATRLGQWVLKHPVTDPMSGFFMTRREIIEPLVPQLKQEGFKVLLDILSLSGPEVRVQEIPYTMRSRCYGHSKLDAHVAWEYLALVLRRLLGRWLPETFILFGLVGLSGVGVHMAILGLLHRAGEWPFLQAQIAATAVAMTSNYILNNRITFRARRLRGMAFLHGLLRFYLYCSIGAIIGVAGADFIFRLATPWWFAGLCGTLLSALWNYALNTLFTWRSPSPHA